MLLGVVTGKGDTIDFIAHYYYYYILATFFACVALMWIIVNSPFGKALQSIRDNETRAEFVGVQVRRHRWVAFLVSGLFTGLVIEHLSLELVTLAPAQIHTQQHLGPILRVGSAGARVDCDDGVERVVFAAEQHPRLALLDLFPEAFERFTQLAGRSLVFSHEFKQHCDVIQEPLLAFSGVERALQTRALL